VEPVGSLACERPPLGAYVWGGLSAALSFKSMHDPCQLRDAINTSSISISYGKSAGFDIVWKKRQPG